MTASHFLLILSLISGVPSLSYNVDSSLEEIDVVPALKSPKNFKTVCYFYMARNLNVTADQPIPKGLNPNLCSHLILIPTFINKQNELVPQTKEHAKIFERGVPFIRKRNPKLTIMVSNAGPWNSVMRGLKNTTEFVNSALVFLRRYDLDGLDLDWEFPSPTQYKNYSTVFKELRQAFEDEAVQTKRPRLLLTSAVVVAEVLAEKIYDFEVMKRSLDFVNMMGYDYNGPWSNLTKTDYNSPLPSLIESSNYWASKIGKDKVMVGIPFYCHAYQLLHPSVHGYHALSDGRGNCDQIGYTCACLAIKNQNASVVFDPVKEVPYCYYGNQWVSFDNPYSLTLKTKWILDNGFPGLMVWAMNKDDTEGECDGKTKYPLMTAVLQTIHHHSEGSKYTVF